MSTDYLRLSTFLSKDKRDAIINEDESFSSLIVMQPRMPWGLNNDTTKVFSELTDAVDEVTWGANIRLSPIIGTNIGLTIYESLYNRVLDPQIRETILGGEDPDYSGDTYYLTYLTNSADTEIEAMYSSTGSSNLWNQAKSFRRAIGIDFSTVIKNISLQAEHGALIKYWEDKFEDVLLESPIGSGPYRVKSLKAGRTIEFERVDNYWGKNLPVNKGSCLLYTSDAADE